MRLARRVAIVTGSGQGIGKAMAVRMAGAGAAVVVNGRDPGKIQNVVMTDEDWDVVLATGLKGTFNCIQAVAPEMMERRYGKIINISSTSGMGGSSRSRGGTYRVPGKAGGIGAHGKAGRDSGRDSVSGIRRVQLHHRTDHRRRRRAHGLHVMNGEGCRAVKQ